MLKKQGHANRTIVVMTRVSESDLHVTYCNALMDDQPYLMTVVSHGPLFVVTGVASADIPEVGHTKVVCQ